METYPGEGVIKEEKFPNTRKSSPWRVCGKFWNLRGQHNQEKKQTNKQTQNLQNTSLNHNSQQRNSPDSPVCHQRVG